MVSCFAKAVFRHVGEYDLEKKYAFTVGEEGRFKVKSREGLTVSVLMNYKIINAEGDIGPYKVRTTAYYYSIENKSGAELIAYHWHPEGTDIPYPQVHVGQGVLKDKEYRLQEKHFPTGRISLEQVMVLAMKEFGVKPIRQDWETVLGHTQGRFDKYKTWG